MILLVDPFCMLGMCCIIRLLESIDSLVQFAQQQDVFICDLVDAIKIYQRQLYTLYNDGFHFILMNCRHLGVYWIAPMNTST
jgi:hypothetical protein